MARIRKDTSARVFFMIVTPDRMYWCSAAVLCQLLGLVKESDPNEILKMKNDIWKMVLSRCPPSTVS
jgi:hypothetical protein